jgi:hypothetical protein
LPTVTLAFPNRSRNFDETRNAVRFFGHDGMFEIRFLVEATALAGSQPPGTQMSEAQCLSAFDTMRTSIYNVAAKVYGRHRKNISILTAADFR